MDIMLVVARDNFASLVKCLYATWDGRLWQASEGVRPTAPTSLMNLCDDSYV